MNLDELERLARAATPGPWDHVITEYDSTYLVRNWIEPSVGAAHYKDNAALIAACSPDVILRLLAVVRAADAMRTSCRSSWEQVWEPPIHAYDDARAQLEQP